MSKPLPLQRGPELFERRGADICISIDSIHGATWVPFWPWALRQQYVKVGRDHLRGDEFLEAMQYATLG